jgi:hypothetical protein
MVEYARKNTRHIVCSFDRNIRLSGTCPWVVTMLAKWAGSLGTDIPIKTATNDTTLYNLHVFYITAGKFTVLLYLSSFTGRKTP